MSTFQHFGKGALRVAKNYTKGYSDTQSKVRDATSNDPWGPSGTQMNEIAQMTYNQNDFVEIMEMLDKRLNDKGKNWRHVFKSLTLLDYCLHGGSENVVIYFRDNLYVIKTLREFQYVDEYDKDQGANVRQKAKDIVNLLQDESRLRDERKSRAHMRDRMVHGGNNYDEDETAENENVRRRSRSVPPGGSARRPPKDDDQLKRAIEESKRSLADDERRKGALTAEERDLLQAIKLSEEEERNRLRGVEDSNASALFDDANQLPANPFPLVDPTGGQFGAVQPQFTQMQPQFTSFNPYQQQAQQEAMQAEYLRQQQEWLAQQQQQAQLQQQQQAQAQLQAQQEEWLLQQQQQQQLLQLQQQQQQQAFLQAQQPLMAQPTGFGSNNPFAPAPAPPLPTQNHSLSPTSPQSSNGISFNLQGTYAGGSGPPLATSPPPPSRSAPPASVPRVATKSDAENAHLASLLANREDGMDTFGNVGALRYGQGAGQVLSQQTGAPSHNPFALQQQQQQQHSDQPFFSI